MRSSEGRRDSKKPRYMMAVVLGGAMTVLGTAAAPEASADTTQAVSAISRYCAACWRNARLRPENWSDCTQEVFSRLLDRVPATEWQRLLASEGDERRELIRAIDTVKKRTQRARKYSGAGVEGLGDPRDEREQRLRRDSAEVRDASVELLSPRQQKVLELSLDGWSVQDIARELRLPAARVSDEKYKMIRKLRGHFASLAV